MFNFIENKKQIVGFSLTPGIGLEAAVIDKTKNQIVNYGRKKVDYNFSQRSIQNYAQFKNALIELIDEMKIPAKSFAYLVLPNVFFDFIELSNDISESGIETALVSTSEEFYIFKKEEPVIGWCDIANAVGVQRKLAYTAFQKSEIDQIKEVFADAGLQLAGIETAYSATLRGLNLVGLVKDAVLMNSSWGALIINTNSFTLFQMEGKNLLEYNEVPLAIKSFSTEEAYDAIVSSVSQLFSGASVSQLYVISQTDDISAEALKKIMQFDKEIIAIDSNKYSKASLMDVTSALDFNDINSVTLAVIGASDINSEFGLNLNILNSDPTASLGVYFTADILGKQTEITAAYVQKVSITSLMFLLLIFGGIIGASQTYNNTQQKELRSIQREISNLDMKIAELEKVEVKQEEIDMTEVIDSVAEDNVKAMNFYDSISQDIPKNVWLTKYYNKNGNNIAIRGVAESIIDIYEYYKNLKIVSPDSNIKLTELRVVTDSNGNAQDDIAKLISSLSIDKDLDRLYSFTISNTEFQIQSSQEENPKEQIDESNLLPNLPDASLTTPIERTSTQMRPAR